MHAGMLSLFALETHKVMQPAQQLQLRRLQAITCVHVLCSMQLTVRQRDCLHLKSFHRRLPYVRQPLGTLESKRQQHRPIQERTASNFYGSNIECP